MKLHGKTPGLNKDVLVLERVDDDFVLTAEAVSDMEEFDRLCPLPEPPAKIMRGGGRVEDYDAPAYKADMDSWANRKSDYYIVKSLQATEGLEWDKVKVEDPGTWHFWREEMREAGLNDMELQRVQMLVFAVNSLSETKLQAARERFFRLERERKAAGAA